MERPKRSLRNTQHCHSIPNAFLSSRADPKLLKLLPSHIKPSICATQTTSCSQVLGLQELGMMRPASEEIALARTAAAYQIDWTSHICTQDVLKMRVQEEGEESGRQPSIHRTARQTRPRQQQPISIWDNQEFLERLQEFIMGQGEGKCLSSTELLFHRQ